MNQCWMPPCAKRVAYYLTAVSYTHLDVYKRQTVDPVLEMTEICDRVLRAGGPAILFENPKGHTIPVLTNLFGTPRRVALGMGEDEVAALREVGKLLALSLIHI